MPDAPNEQEISVDVSDLAEGRSRVVECGRRKLLLCHAAGEFFAVAERCSHAAYSMAEGRIEGTKIECPLHGAVFDLRDGSPLRRPASKPLATYPVTTDGARAVIVVPADTPTGKREPTG